MLTTPDTDIIPTPRKEGTALTILVVEDNRIERMFMEEQIRELGHVMLAAENGQQAIDMLMAMETPVDIILMDRMMPVMDGLTAIRRIKDQPALRRIPIVMVTGAASAQDIQEGLDAGAFEYLTKPVNEDVLKSALAAAMQGLR